jgi:AcrR family transcriptional regulator
MPTPRPLPIVGPPPRVRRDAAANSERILCAAREVIGTDGVESLTMDRLAAAAGVGKGTVFRAFGNRTGLFAALTDQTERDFQQRFLTGEPPLGPDAPPLDRLLAYGAERLRLTSVHAALLLAGVGRVEDKFTVPAREVSSVHVRMLLRQCGIRDNLEVICEALLAPLDVDVAHYLTANRGLSTDDLIVGWQSLVRSVAGLGE